MTELPTGTVTFLFTDIEGSTRLLQELGDAYRAVQDRHGELMRAAIRAHDGHEVRTEGDSFFVAFRTPAQGVRAAVDAQRGLGREEWLLGSPLQVRIGMHTGEGVLGGGDYIGIDVNRAARIAAAGHGGQVLLSDATRTLVEDTLPEGVGVRDLGSHALKDFDEPRHLFDLVIEGLPADFPPIRTLERSGRAGLPAPRTSFVGRERELEEIQDLLAEVRLLTLTGPGGTGKTRLALRAAADQVDRLEDGVVFVDLSAVTDPDLVPSTIASTLGLRQDPATDPLETLAGHLRERELLMVLDNVEQVGEEGSASVDRLLNAAPRLRVLATSRVPLHLSGEHEYAVRPLPLPDSDRPELKTLTTCESVMLFVARAAAVRRDFRLDEANAASVAEITRRLDGLPLAIELAASRIKMLSPQTLLERLEHRLPLLTGGPRDLPERQQTLRGAIEWSHDLLEPGERRLFARLAAFRGGWTLEAAEEVTGPGLELDVVQGLGSLIDKSLVRQQQSRRGEVRFRMLETIHEYAAERLAASGEEEEIRRRHAEHVRALAEEGEPHLMGEGQTRWLDRLEREHDNVRAALDWAEAAGEAVIALRTAAAIWRFWQQGGHLAEGRGRLDSILALPGAQVRSIPRARALGALGGVAYWQNDYEVIGPVYEEAVEIAREAGDQRVLARALFDLSFVPLVTNQQDFDRQRELLREALATAPKDDLSLRGQILTGFGYLPTFSGRDPGSGIEHIEKALAIHRELGDRLLTAENLIGLASLKLLTGDPAAAWGHLGEAVAILAEPRSPVMLAMALSALAFLANRDGDHQRTARLLGAGNRIKDEGGGAPPSFALSRLGDPEGDARAALGDEAFEQAHAEGYAMTMEQARAYAVELVERPER